MGMYGSVWECMGVYGGAAAAATHNVAFVRQCSHTFPYFPILSHTFPYFPIKKAAINHIARVCGEKKSRSKKCSGF